MILRYAISTSLNGYSGRTVFFERLNLLFLPWRGREAAVAAAPAGDAGHGECWLEVGLRRKSREDVGRQAFGRGAIVAHQAVLHIFGTGQAAMILLRGERARAK